MERKLNAESLVYALYATNADAMLVETLEDAETVAAQCDGCTLKEVLPTDEDDFADVCARLDLTDANEPKRVFKILDGDTVTGFVAFKGDWKEA